MQKFNLKMNHNSELIEKIKAFIAQECNIEIEKITMETPLREKLFDGDDADLFMWDFFHIFEIDFSNFKFDRYFNPEPTLLDPFLFLLNLIKGKKLQTIKVKKLVEVAQAKKWV